VDKYVPSNGFDVALFVVVLSMKEGVPTMDVGLTANSPSLPFFVPSRRIESTQISETIDLNFTAKSTIRLPHLQKPKMYK